MEEASDSPKSSTPGSTASRRKGPPPPLHLDKNGPAVWNESRVAGAKATQKATPTGSTNVSSPESPNRSSMVTINAAMYEETPKQRTRTTLPGSETNHASLPRGFRTTTSPVSLKKQNPLGQPVAGSKTSPPSTSGSSPSEECQSDLDTTHTSKSPTLEYLKPHLAAPMRQQVAETPIEELTPEKLRQRINDSLSIPLREYVAQGWQRPDTVLEAKESPEPIRMSDEVSVGAVRPLKKSVQSTGNNSRSDGASRQAMGGSSPMNLAQLARMSLNDAPNNTRPRVNPIGSGINSKAGGSKPHGVPGYSSAESASSRNSSGSGVSLSSILGMKSRMK